MKRLLAWLQHRHHFTLTDFVQRDGQQYWLACRCSCGKSRYTLVRIES